MTNRQLIERPFRHYADFSGRSGRAEYWLLILMFVVLTEVAWLIGFGGMRLAGYEAHDHAASFHHMFETKRNGENRTDLRDFMDDEEDSHIVFKLHRHGEEGLHLHGDIRTWHKHQHGHEESGSSVDPTLEQEAPKPIFRFGHHYDDATDAEDGADLLELIVALALLVPILATGARRLHDSGKTGWWQLFVLIPFAGWLVLIIFFLLRGEPNENRFGPPAV